MLFRYFLIGNLIYLKFLIKKNKQFLKVLEKNHHLKFQQNKYLIQFQTMKIFKILELIVKEVIFSNIELLILPQQARVLFKKSRNSITRENN